MLNIFWGLMLDKASRSFQNCSFERMNIFVNGVISCLEGHAVYIGPRSELPVAKVCKALNKPDFSELMSNNMNSVWITLLLLAATFFAHGAATICFVRSGSTDTSNGTATSCTGFPYCYSYMSSSYQYAGCSMTAGYCSSTRSCVTCSTDNCNSVTPSSISCFDRSGASSNGTQVTCPTGIFTCYSEMQGSSTYGGCGSCFSNKDCITCNTSYCNALTPSSISCHYRREILWTLTSNGNSIACPTGLSTCYSYTTDLSTHGGCGTINDVSSLTCSTNNCNTFLPSSISCFCRGGSYIYSGSTSNSNGTITPCSTGFATCVSYLVPYGYQSFISYSGCGVCNATASALYGCTTCNTSNCNYLPANFTSAPQPAPNAASNQPGTVTSTTAAPNAASNQPGTVTSTTAAPNAVSNQPGTVTSTTARTSGQPSSVNCFYSFAETTSNGRRKVTCDSGGSCFEYSFKIGFIDYFFAGCGNCTAYSIFGCRACGTDYCNSAAVTAGNCAVAAVVAGFVALALMQLRDVTDL